MFTLDTAIVPGLACPPRGKRHDYFTSALPWTQKGPGVSVGLAGTVTLVDPSPVSGYFVQQSNNNLGAAQLSKDGGVHSVFTGSDSLNYSGGYDVSIAGHAIKGSGTATVTAQPGSSWLSKSAYADLDSSSIFTINSLRTAFQMQKFYERLARGGSRDRKSTRLNSSHRSLSRMPSSA